jgi:hypothetical protein
MEINVRQERTVFTHSLLHNAAYIALKDGRERGLESDFMNSLVMSAFCLEAYLNFAGEQIFSYWNYIERLQVPNKLGLICKHLQIEMDFSKRPYQSIKQLWGFRNFMAHARTETVKDGRKQPAGVPINRELPQTEWEKLCTDKVATRIIEDVEQVIRDIHTKGGLQIGALGLLHIGGGSLRNE